MSGEYYVVGRLKGRHFIFMHQQRCIPIVLQIIMSIAILFTSTVSFSARFKIEDYSFTKGIFKFLVIFYLTLVRMGLFGAAHGWGEAKRPPP